MSDLVWFRGYTLSGRRMLPAVFFLLACVGSVCNAENETTFDENALAQLPPFHGMHAIRKEHSSIFRYSYWSYSREIGDKEFIHAQSTAKLHYNEAWLDVTMSFTPNSEYILSNYLDTASKKLIRRVARFFNELSQYPMPNVQMAVTIVEPGISLEIGQTLSSDDVITLRFYFTGPPRQYSSDPLDVTTWLMEIWKSLSHELFHIYFRETKDKYVERGSEEIAAKIWEYCTALAVLRGGVQLRFEINGSLVDPEEDYPRRKQYSITGNEALDAFYEPLAIHNMAAAVGVSTINPGNMLAQGQLLGLCRALMQNPARMDEQYYAQEYESMDAGTLFDRLDK